MKPGDYDSIYSDGIVLDAIRDHMWNQDYDLYSLREEFGLPDYSNEELDLASLEEYEHIVPANWVVDLVPEGWISA